MYQTWIWPIFLIAQLVNALLWYSFYSCFTPGPLFYLSLKYEKLWKWMMKNTARLQKGPWPLLSGSNWYLQESTWSNRISFWYSDIAGHHPIARPWLPPENPKGGRYRNPKPLLSISRDNRHSYHIMPPSHPQTISTPLVGSVSDALGHFRITTS